jgi:hypothetical protein
MADQNPPPDLAPAPAIPAIPAIPADVANGLLALAQAMAANNANTAAILTALTANAINIPASNVGRKQHQSNLQTGTFQPLHLNRLYVLHQHLRQAG